MKNGLATLFDIADGPCTVPLKYIWPKLFRALSHQMGKVQTILHAFFPNLSFEMALMEINIVIIQSKLDNYDFKTWGLAFFTISSMKDVFCAI